MLSPSIYSKQMSHTACSIMPGTLLHIHHCTTCLLLMNMQHICLNAVQLHRQEMAYFDARSKGLVQTNNSKQFPIDQYLHDRMTPATLSPTPLAYEKLIHPTEMPCITTCTELSVDDTNKPTSD